MNESTTTTTSLERRLRLLEFQSDLEADPASEPNRSRRQAENVHLAQEALQMIGGLLDQADRGLSEVENNDLLGSALVRGCQELADAVGHLAEQLEEHQTDPERRALAEACLQDFNSGLLLDEEQQQQQCSSTSGSSSTQLLDQQQQQQELQNKDGAGALTQDDFVAALGAASELLRDVEVALRAIEQDEAEDLADAAIGVAHLFLLSCRQLHAQVTPQTLAESIEDAHHNDNTSYYRESPNIEILGEEDEPNTLRNRKTSNTSTASNQQTSSSSTRSKHLPQPERLRCMWPPVGPAVGQALQWTKKEMEKQHWLLTAALAITLWPVAVVTAVVGTPAVLADHCLQSVYQHFQNGPLVTAAEVAAAQIFQTSRLLLLTGKAVAKPTVRVAQRQIQRHGPAVQDWAVDKLTHPVDTVQETAKGLLWCTGQVVGLVQHQMQKWHENFDNEDEVVVFQSQPSVEELLSL